MSLFESSTNNPHHFPSEPAFLVPVEVRDTPRLGQGQRGIFAAAPIAAKTKFWTWTDRVKKIRHDRLGEYIAENFGGDAERTTIFLRQGFVLPGEGNDDHFCSNPTDAGRFMNHSPNPNCGPDGTLRDISEGEEMTMDYGFHGNPQWYIDICKKYGVKTEAEIALEHS
mmetsp:Transcript_18384/g.42257  ORF Transcript_18384/g.42257 Transcript_18384/m.42257 type:complete len:168 (-) Transcript_18384:151-654(-)